MPPGDEPMFPAADTRPRCPYCGEISDGFTRVDGDDEEPTEGAVGICLYCLGVSIYTGVGLHKRKPTREELVEIMADDDVVQAIHRLETWPGRPT
jgi:hypothetical protein